MTTVTSSAAPFILALDTSCDETAIAIVCGHDIRANIVASQVQLHKQYGGVFPTVAKQAHKEQLPVALKAAFRQAQLKPADIAAIAITVGPGLAPALEVGITFAQQLAEEWKVPLLPINHIEGHLLSVLARPHSRAKQLDNSSTEPRWPILGVIVSGKHTEYILMSGWGEYRRLGWTVDDAAGEALDKVGRMLDLGYPAGPVIEEFARLGDAKAFKFPLPMTTSGDYNLSFSGLKTFARNTIEQLNAEDRLTKQVVYDFCASFQYAVFRSITYKLSKILTDHQVDEVWLGGGAAANIALRTQLRVALKPFGLHLRVPYSKRLCGDNAAMIGMVASHRLAGFVPSATPLDRRPRWHLDEE